MEKFAYHRIRVVGLALSLGLILTGIGMRLAAPAAAGDVSPVEQGATTATPELQLPTATSTLVGGPTATPSRTPTLTPVLAEALGDINLRSGPGLDFDIVGELTAGNTVPIIGRSVQYPWLQVSWAEAPSGTAWVYEQLVRVIGDITTIPIVDAPELPTIDPTQAVIQATATVLLQTPGAAETATATAFFAPTGVYTFTPGGPAAAAPGVNPTFTPPEPYQPVETLLPPNQPPSEQSGPAPAVVIVALGLMGVLTIVMGLIRRI